MKKCCMVFFFIFTLGPGAYDLPAIVGNKRVDALYNNVPSYTFSKNQFPCKQFISKEHCKVLISKSKI